MKFFKYEKRIIISLSVLFFVLLLLFLVRNEVLRKILQKIDSRLYTNLQLHISTDKARFAGLRTIELYKFQIKDSTGDTILHTGKIFCSVKILPLFAGNIRFSKIYIENFSSKIDSGIIDKYRNSKKTDSLARNDSTQINYDKYVNRALNSFFDFIPDELTVDTFLFEYTRNDNKLHVYTPELSLKKGFLKTELYLSDDQKNVCSLKGNFNKGDREINIFAVNPLKQAVTIPYLSSKLGLTIKFDSLNFKLYNVENSANTFSFYTNINIEKFYIEHKRIAPSAVITNHFNSDFKINVGNRFIEIDSTSLFTINDFTISPYAKYSRSSEREFFIKIPQFTFKASDMFNSFPKGLFNSICDMKVSGELTYSFNCYVNLNNPDSVIISSDLASKDFRILKYGLANLQMINDNFVYNIYEKNELVSSFELCPDNPDFVTLTEIPSILEYSVLTSEDGGFFHHKGFSEESFKKAISDNLKEGRFARGGSTITMQLVKNVYLNKNKTISRKLEEMLIVWMIENMHLVSKERMLEVYLNIIEWGPHIYGIKQASKYYFNKQPKELNLQECIFLASIIPSPKNFKYAFKAPGKLNDYYAWFYKRLPDVMIRREQLSPNDTIGLKPEVTLKGEAKNYIEMDSVLNARFFQYAGTDDDE